MTTTKQRIQWVDMGKYICIMFVMMSHLESGSARLTKFYTPFFLAVFFFLSGYVYRQPESFRELLVKKARGLLVPWILFSTFSLLLSRVANYDPSVKYLARFGWNLAQIRGMGDEIWFVTALFMAFLPFYFFAKWDRPGWAMALMAALCGLSMAYDRHMPALPWGSNKLPWHLEFIFQAGFWMLLGYDFKLYGEEIFDRLNTARNRIFLWAAYLLVVYGPVDWLREIPQLLHVLGILAVVSVCKVMKSNRYIRFVGANTLTYFALHGWVYAAVQLAVKKCAGGYYEIWLTHDLSSDLVAIGITLVVSVLLMIPAAVINKWFPWVLGKKRVK